MKHVPDNEVKIITNLVDSILAHEDLAICVRDEEDVAMQTTRNRKDILSVIGDTEVTILKIKKLLVLSKEISKFKRSEIENYGFITLIHGNGEDVISDYSENLKDMFSL